MLARPIPATGRDQSRPVALTGRRLHRRLQRLSPEPERFEGLLEVLGALYAEAPNFTVEELGSITVPVLIPGTGHFAPFARPEEFNRNVLTFLAGGAIATPTT